MRSRNHPNDWQRQQEQLSAYLDGEVNAEERAEIERHLPSCSDCRQALAELRSVHTLLRALPASRPPRSFALPETAAPQPLPRTPVIRQVANQPAQRPPWYRISQWAGSVAACVGLLLLLGSTLISLPTQRFGANMPVSSGSQTSMSAPGRSPNAEKSQPGTSATVVSTTPAATPTIGRVTAPAPEPQEPEVPILPLTGLGLLAGGAVVVVAGRFAARRT